MISRRSTLRLWCCREPVPAVIEHFIALTIMLGAAMAPAHAGRPMIVNDAGIVEEKSCQLESWVQKNRDNTEYWALPACNFTGNLELTLGGARIRGDEESFSTVVMQGKTLFKPLNTNGWGAGLVFGNEFDASGSIAGDFYATVPVSFSFLDDRVLLHANLGWQHERETRRHAATWGLATEIRLAERLALISEAFGENRGKPHFHLGLRYWIIPERFQIDAGYGDRFGKGSAERFSSIGFVVFTEAFLP